MKSKKNYFKIFLYFLGTIIVSQIIVWNFIASDVFSRYVSGYLSEKLQNNANVFFKYDAVNVKLFPPALLFKNVQVKSKKEIGVLDSADLSIHELKVDFNVFTHIGNKIKISNIQLSGGSIDLHFNDSVFQSHGPKLLWNNKIFNDLFNFLDFKIIEVLRVALNDINLTSNMVSTQVEHISWEILKSDKNILTKLVLKDLKAESLLEQQDVMIKNYNSYAKAITALAFEGLISQENLDVRLLDLMVNSRMRVMIDGTLQHPFNLKNGYWKLQNSVTWNYGPSSSSAAAASEFSKISHKQTSKEKVVTAEKVNIDTNSQLSDEETIFTNYLKRIGIFQFDLKNKSSITGSILKPDIQINAEVENFRSKYVDLAKINTVGTIDWSRILMKHLWLRDLTNGEAQVMQQFFEYNFTTNKLNINASGICKKLSLKNSIKIVTEVSKRIESKLDGEVTIQSKGSLFPMDIRVNKLLSANNLKVTLDSGQLINIPQLNLHNALFTVDRGLQINAIGSIGKHSIEISGDVNEQKINISSNNSTINLKDISPISEIDLTGEGKVAVHVTGATKNPILSFRFDDLMDSSILGLQLGQLSGNVDVNLESNKVSFSNLVSKISPGTLKAEGEIQLKDKDCNIVVTGNNLTYDNIVFSHRRMLPDFINLNSQVLGGIDLAYLITGKINNLKKLIVNAKFKASRLSIYQEDFFDLKGSLFFKDNQVKVPETTIRKGRGIIEAAFFFNLEDRHFSSSFKTEKLMTSDFYNYNHLNTSFNAELEFNGAYVQTPNKKEGAMTVIAKNSKIAGSLISDSFISLAMINNELNIKGRYADDWILLNSRIDFSQKQSDSQKNSFFTLKTKIDDWSQLLNIFTAFDVQDPILKGKLYVDVDSIFNWQNLSNLDLQVDFNKFSFDHPQLKIEKSNQSGIDIQNGWIRKWDITLKGLQNNHLISRAKGSLQNDAIIENVFDFNVSKINYFLRSYWDFYGEVKTQMVVTLKNLATNLASKFSLKYNGKISSNDLSMRAQTLPIHFDNINMNLEFDNTGIFIKKFQGMMGQGGFDVKGQCLFGDNMPKLALNYKIKDGAVSLASRSQMILSGDGALTGSAPPYSLSGDFKINSGEINNEFDEFKSMSKNSYADIKFLPTNKKSNEPQSFLNLNLTLASEKAILIRNSIADIGIMSNFSIQGTPNNPEVSGRVITKGDRDNTIVVKNNNFKFNRLFIAFDPKSGLKNPSIDMETEAKISDYTVRTKVYGHLKNYQLDLSSEPNLSRQSILSLIAFGYAEEISENLYDKDREALSSVGVGTFIFDQLKLNESLHQNLGVTLNVGTEFVNDNNSLLQSRPNGQNSGGGVGRVRTATKIELRKKIDEKTDMAVSSTVGGSIGQKQSMNLNYGINKKVSLDGVYEINTSTARGEGQSAQEGVSVGGDVKFKWTFK